MKITIVSGIQLSNNPRVVKEADALAAAGFDVRVLCSLLDPKFEDRERALYEGKDWECVRVFDATAASKSTVLYRRIRTRLANEIYRLTGHGSVSQLGYVGPELLRECLKHPADLYSVHLEQAFCVGAKLVKRGLPVAADFEDWYSEDLLPAARAKRPVKLLSESEEALLKQCRYTLTTSRALSAGLATRYQADAPLVVPNTFSLAERKQLDGRVKDRRDQGKISLFWFSQRIGPRRGLEELMQATHYLSQPLEIHLRGTMAAGFREELLEMAAPSAREHIFFHEQVPHSELLSRIAEHDIGYAAEVGYCPSRDLTITNKIFQYLLAGIPILATDTAGQCEVAVDVPDAIKTFAQDKPKQLADHLNQAMDGQWDLKLGRDAALKAALQKYNWEASQTVLVEAAREALQAS